MIDNEPLGRNTDDGIVLVELKHPDEGYIRGMPFTPELRLIAREVVTADSVTEELSVELVDGGLAVRVEVGFPLEDLDAVDKVIDALQRWKRHVLR